MVMRCYTKRCRAVSFVNCTELQDRVRAEALKDRGHSGLDTALHRIRSPVCECELFRSIHKKNKSRDQSQDNSMGENTVWLVVRLT
jgi:hypothetical protein